MPNKPKREMKVKVKDLPKEEKQLSKEEQKKVKGASMIPGIGTAVGAAERK